MNHTDSETTQDIDGSYDQTGDGITTDKLGGTVHSPVEISLLTDLLTPQAGFLFVDYTIVEIGVDRHLFTWHSVEGESGCDFRHPSGTLGDNDEVDKNQDQENDETNDVVALDHETTEGGNHLSGVAITQNQSGRGNIKGQSKKRD